MRAWLRGPFLGALVGLPILGGGGRLAMHAVSILSADAQHSVTVQGTITVLLSGVAAGVAGGVVYALLAKVLPARRFLRDTLFALVLTLLTVRGLHPVQPLTLLLFMPVVLVYGVVLERAWHARSLSSYPLHASR